MLLLSVQEQRLPCSQCLIRSDNFPLLLLSKFRFRQNSASLMLSEIYFLGTVRVPLLWFCDNTSLCWYCQNSASLTLSEFCSLSRHFILLIYCQKSAFFILSEFCLLFKHFILLILSEIILLAVRTLYSVNILSKFRFFDAVKILLAVQTLHYVNILSEFCLLSKHFIMLIYCQNSAFSACCSNTPLC